VSGGVEGRSHELVYRRGTTCELLRRSAKRGDLTARVRAIRQVDDGSDAAIRQLLDRGDELALEVILVALIPMLRHRCRNDRTKADEALGELSIVLAEFSRSGVPTTSRRLANLIVDRAWDAHRCTMRRERRAAFPVDPSRSYLFDEHSIDTGHRQVLDRVALHDFRDQLVKSQAAHPKASAAWNEALELALMERRTSAQRNRWKYVRLQLRKLAPPELSV
jgi:hypothetical protein